MTHKLYTPNLETDLKYSYLASRVVSNKYCGNSLLKTFLLGVFYPKSLKNGFFFLYAHIPDFCHKGLLEKETERGSLEVLETTRLALWDLHKTSRLPDFPIEKIRKPSENLSGSEPKFWKEYIFRIVETKSFERGWGTFTSATTFLHFVCMHDMEKLSRNIAHILSRSVAMLPRSFQSFRFHIEIPEYLAPFHQFAGSAFFV